MREAPTSPDVRKRYAISENRGPPQLDSAIFSRDLSEVLGRVATGVHDVPRGPDVLHRVTVPHEWLLRGATIDITLPRNLACAKCSGGGCDRCERSGAVSLRRRGEPEDVVTVPLPVRSSEEIEREPSIVLRIPGHGGHAQLGLDLPRGLLLLRVQAGEAPPEEARVRTPVPAPRLSNPPVPVPSGALQAPPRKFSPGVLAVFFLLLCVAAGLIAHYRR